MDANAYVGVGILVVGLVMAATGLARRDNGEALHSFAFSLLGAVALTASFVEGPLSWVIMVSLGVVAMILSRAARRLSRQLVDPGTEHTSTEEEEKGR